MLYSRRIRPRGAPRNERVLFFAAPDELSRMAQLQDNLVVGTRVSRAFIIRHALDLLERLYNQGYRIEAEKA